MNKNDLKVFVDSLGLPKGEFSILSSGSLVLRGIQDEANDLDLHVSQSCFQYIKQNFDITFKDLKHEYNNPLYHMNDFDVDFFVMDENEMHFDYVDGYPCQDVDEILSYKLKRNLEKDKASVAKILEYKKTHIK